MISPVFIAGIRGRSSIKPWCLTPSGTKFKMGFNEGLGVGE